MAVIASGSVAFDYIMTFDGRFGDHIMPDRKHMINLSFLVERFEKRRGGVAANYAYTLALLGYPGAVLATAGEDAAGYRDWLAELGVDVSGLRLLDGWTSATGFNTTDLDGNQIWGYYGGAMLEAAQLGLDDTEARPEALIVGPNAPAAMFRLVDEARERNLPWVFDPAHQLPHLSAEDLERGARGAWILIGNDYETQLVQERTGRDLKGLLELAEVVVTTMGKDGSQIDTREGSHRIPAAAPREVVDPTGAGDAYRAGLVASRLLGLGWEEAGRVASLASTYVVEQRGTIDHSYTLPEFAERYRQAFGSELPAALTAAPSADARA
jgi:adenosine kinase